MANGRAYLGESRPNAGKNGAISVVTVHDSIVEEGERKVREVNCPLRPSWPRLRKASDFSTAESAQALLNYWRGHLRAGILYSQRYVYVEAAG